MTHFSEQSWSAPGWKHQKSEDDGSPFWWTKRVILRQPRCQIRISHKSTTVFLHKLVSQGCRPEDSCKKPHPPADLCETLIFFLISILPLTEELDNTNPIPKTHTCLQVCEKRLEIANCHGNQWKNERTGHLLQYHRTLPLLHPAKEATNVSRFRAGRTLQGANHTKRQPCDLLFHFRPR